MTLPPVVAARKVGDGGGSPDDFTYAILAEPVRAVGERRAMVRSRTRLRSGKVMSADGQFVAECLIANRSIQGGLLRLPGTIALPGRILLYDDQSGDLLAATVIWRRGRQIGIRFGVAERSARLQSIAGNMRRKFYAVRD